MMRYRLSEIADIVGGTLMGCDQDICAISTDSRDSLLRPSTLFVAMRGVNHDSHSFISDMVQRGVSAFLTEREIDRIENFDTANDKVSYIKVSNAIEALQLLATHHRKQFKGCIIGITGSNGKTTVKEWFAQMAPNSIKLFRSPRSYNSQLGVALSLLMLEGDEDVALIEAGISRPEEMERLWAMIRPDIAVVTAIGDAHQEGFTSLAQKIEEKLLLAHGAKHIIYNSSYSDLCSAVLYLSDTNIIDAAEFTLDCDLADVASMRNAQIVAALHHLLGYSAPDFGRLAPVAMRLELIEGLHDSIILNDSYNNDINSLAIALEALQRAAGQRPRMVILSDILQSGVDPDTLYSKVAEVINSANIERMIVIGDTISKYVAKFACSMHSYTTTEELLNNISDSEYGGHAILIKGNRDCKLEKISHALAKQSHTTVLEVNLDTMIGNLNRCRAMLSPESDCKITAMVKASSYGAGDFEVAQMLQEQGVDYLAVAFTDEGCRLRERGITMPIIVLNADDGSFSQMVQMGLEPEIYSLSSLRSFASAVQAHGEREYPIHIKLDTGMHRLGFLVTDTADDNKSRDIEQLLDELKSLQGVVRVASIFSHLACADVETTEGRNATLKQIELFDKVSKGIEGVLGYPTLRHIANSAAIAKYPESHFDMVRLGIDLYNGVSTLKSRIVQIREVGCNSLVGYGGVGKCRGDKPSLIATVPIGYADGLDRHLSNGAWSLLVNGVSAPIIGRVCMDSCMIDITDIAGVREGDEVVIFSPAEGNRVEDMARVLDTISYEVLTSISARVKRIYIKE